MKRFAFILILPLAFACKTQKNASEEVVETTTPSEMSSEGQNDPEEASITEEAPQESNTKPQKPYRTKAKLGETNTKTDHYNIISASIEGKLLMMTFEYSGGCAKHDFECIGSKGISKSLPPQRTIKLMHNNGDDMCEAIVRREIEIDISEMAYKQTSGSEIILNLQGYEEPLKFVYP